MCVCWLVYCLHVLGIAVEGVGVWCTGEIKQSLAGKQPPCCPPHPPLSTPPPPRPPAAILSRRVFDPSIVRWCTSSCGGLSNLHKDICLVGMKLKYNHLDEKKKHVELTDYISPKFALYFSVFFPHISDKFIDFWLGFRLLWVKYVACIVACMYVPVSYFLSLICPIYNCWVCGSASANLCTPSQRRVKAEVHCGGGFCDANEQKWSVDWNCHWNVKLFKIPRVFLKKKHTKKKPSTRCILQKKKKSIGDKLHAGRLQVAFNQQISLTKLLIQQYQMWWQLNFTVR